MAKKRKVPEVDSTSTADIAFMLLIFFIVATTMSVDSGITRKLPPIQDNKDQEEEIKVKERNVLIVLLNRNNDLFVESGPLDISELKETTKEFIANVGFKNETAKSETLPEMVLLSQKRDKALNEKEPNESKAKKYQAAIDALGDRYVSKGVVSLQNDRSTKYEAYIKVQDELMRAFNELKDELAKEKFGKLFEDLDKTEQDFIKLVYPLAISEAEPANTGGN